LTDKIYSVSELNNHIKSLLDADPMLGGIYVCGELSNYKIYPSGHHYFTMKDADCAVRCVMFKSSAGKLRFRPESGMKVTAFGRVTVFPRDGAYQLYVSELIPEGVGDLQVAFEQLKAKLEAEGLFDRRFKKPIPRFPTRVAVVTSGAGAAVRDIIRVLRKRWPLAKVILLPVRVQGAEAPAEVTGAIRYANKYEVGDVMIVGRGGGSIEDLWAFNDERVARAIFDSKIPVISAVGHEPDVTISDYVADLRAATPSNGAELAAPDKEELFEILDSLSGRMGQYMRKEIEGLKTRLRALQESRALSDPKNYIDDRRVLVDHVQLKLIGAQEKINAGNRNRFSSLAASLDAMSPLKVLGRGYAVAQREDGAVIKSAEDVKPGDNIKVRLKKDSISCTVIKEQ
jgi:exodeoxyribonuclease VII large subunit